MAEIVETEAFSKWLKALRDPLGKRSILRRLARIVSTGHFGDHAGVGDGVSELRIDAGPGYRVYYSCVRSGSCCCSAAATRIRRIGTSGGRRSWRFKWNDGREAHD